MIKKSIKKSGLILNLNTKSHTASIKRLNKAVDSIEIPRSINFQSSEYVIKSIMPHAFYNYCDSRMHVKSVSFAKDSEVSIFLSKSFYFSPIESLSLPSSLKYLGNGWCQETRSLTKISISPKNKNFIYYNEKMILGKSNEFEENYDTIYFARRDITDVQIPSFIKYINSSAFDSCCEIKTLVINEDSELLSIQNNAFASSSIEHFFIPSKLMKIAENWCDDAKRLVDVTVSSQNKKYIKDKDSGIIFYKTDINNESYDAILFAPRNIKNVEIPSFVKYINDYAFAYCCYVTTITFEENSQIQSISNLCFYESHIGKICIPPSVEIIERAFQDLTIDAIEFHQDSRLKIIGCAAFTGAVLLNIIIPSSVEKIGENAFENSAIKKVEFEKNSKLKIIDYMAFYNCPIKSIQIPSSVETIGALCFSNCELVIVEIEEENRKKNVKTINISKETFNDPYNNFVLFAPVCTEIITTSKEKNKNDEEEEEEEEEEYID